MGLDITKGTWNNTKKAVRVPLTAKYKSLVKRGASAHIIATVFGETKKQAEANAKLIAGAPDLLEALQFCKSVIEHSGIFDLSEKMAFDKATAAINKASYCK